MYRIRFILVSVCIFVARPLHAQATADTVRAFRSGQWGIEFIPTGASVAEAGVLRFSTPTRAWVLDGSATFSRQNASGTNGEQAAQSIDVKLPL